jgi:hypothetical protein
MDMVASIQVKKYSSQRKKVIFMVPVPNTTVCEKKKSKGRKNVRVGAGAVAGAGDVIRINGSAELEPTG